MLFWSTSAFLWNFGFLKKLIWVRMSCESNSLLAISRKLSNKKYSPLYGCSEISITLRIKEAKPL